jgi:hypothetical protein
VSMLPRHGVCRVVEHLPHDFPSKARVTTPLHLHEGRDGVLIEEEVIDRPPADPGLIPWDGDLSRDQQPLPRGGAVHLVSCE